MAAIDSYILDLIRIAAVTCVKLVEIRHWIFGAMLSSGKTRIFGYGIHTCSVPC